jgi:hypothetical protein
MDDIFDLLVKIHDFLNSPDGQVNRVGWDVQEYDNRRTKALINEIANALDTRADQDSSFLEEDELPISARDALHHLTKVLRHSSTVTWIKPDGSENTYHTILRSELFRLRNEWGHLKV